MAVKNQWLSWLTREMVKGVTGAELSSYTIALEAWRRGLIVTFLDKDLRRYSITSKQKWRNGLSFNFRVKTAPKISLEPNVKKITFNRSKIIDKHSAIAGKICINKDLTKKWLAKANVPVPTGKRFSVDTPVNEIIAYAKQIGFPVVLKPACGSMGTAVYTNIKEEKLLKELVIQVRKKYPDVIVEEYIEGKDYRIYVLGNKVIGVIERIPANIVGDGKNTIEQLIYYKNEERKKNPFLAKGLIKIDDELLRFISDRGYSLESVPKSGELVFLRGKNNASAGGDSIDATDEVSDKIKEIAVKAVKAIPHLNQCGVDILVNENNQDKPGVVIELNSRAEIGLHLFPLIGQARDIPGAIIDYYFPESCRYSTKNRRLVYNVQSVLSPFMVGAASSVTLPPIPSGKRIFKRIEISGQFQSVGFKKWVQKNALKLNLFGYVKKLKSGNLLIIVSGEKEDIKSFIKKCEKGPKNVRVEEVKVGKWNKHVEAGFRII